MFVREGVIDLFFIVLLVILKDKLEDRCVNDDVNGKGNGEMEEG